MQKNQLWIRVNCQNNQFALLVVCKWISNCFLLGCSIKSPVIEKKSEKIRKAVSI